MCLWSTLGLWVNPKVNTLRTYYYLRSQFISKNKYSHSTNIGRRLSLLIIKPVPLPWKHKRGRGWRGLYKRRITLELIWWGENFDKLPNDNEIPISDSKNCTRHHRTDRTGVDCRDYS